MCYNAYAMTKKRLDYARRHGGTKEEIEELADQLELLSENEFPKPFYHTNGFQHPNLLVIANDEPMKFKAFHWGLIPFWVKDEATAGKLQNQTINARGESIFEKPSFREPANKRRNLIFIDGFFEYHHYKGKTYPFLIKFKNDDPMLVGGIWDSWVNKETGEEIKTTSIVTTWANPIMSKIHNNPKLQEPRMPLILNDETKEIWLKGSKEEVEAIIRPYPEEELEYYTVRRLTGKDAVGNVPEALEPFNYPELVFDGFSGQVSLF